MLRKLSRYLVDRRKSKVQPYEKEYVLNIFKELSKSSDTISTYELRKRCNMPLDKILPILSKLMDEDRIFLMEE